MDLKIVPLMQKLCLDVIKIGRIPNHMALILDGNRRFAARFNEGALFGNTIGFDRLFEVIKITRYLGVRYCTIYIFSIENFKRSKDEVQSFFELVEEKIHYFLENIDKLKKMGACFRFVGNHSMIPKKLFSKMNKLYMETRMGTDYYLNVAFAYTSRDEIAHSISTIRNGLKTDVLTESDVDESLLNACTYLGDLPKVDLLIRTSGVKHFSDFLLLQISDAHIMFIDCTWPEFTFFKCLYCVIKYQRNHQRVQIPYETQSTEASMVFRRNCEAELFKIMFDSANEKYD